MISKSIFFLGFALLLLVATATAYKASVSQASAFGDSTPFYNLFEDGEDGYQMPEIDGGDINAIVPTFDTPRQAMLFYFGPNSTSTEEENVEFVSNLRDSTRNDASIQRMRESKVQMMFGMDVNEFDQIAEDYRVRLIKFASSMNLDFSIFTSSYDEVITACREQLIESYNLIDLDDFNTFADELNELEEGRELFIQSVTLLPTDIEDLVLQSVVNLDPMINWASSFLLNRKCEWCKKLAGYIKSKACGKAGSLVCRWIATATTQALAPVFIKFGCGAPFNLASHLGNLCQKGVNWLQGKGHVTDTKICKSISFGTIRIPNHNGAIFRCSAKTIRIGSLC